jgi:hypothetical protein
MNRACTTIPSAARPTQTVEAAVSPRPRNGTTSAAPTRQDRTMIAQSMTSAARTAPANPPMRKVATPIDPGANRSTLTSAMYSPA